MTVFELLLSCDNANGEIVICIIDELGETFTLDNRAGAIGTIMYANKITQEWLNKDVDAFCVALTESGALMTIRTLA